MTGRKLCTRYECDQHATDPEWLHLPPRRDTPPLTVRLQARRAAA